MIVRLAELEKDGPAILAGAKDFISRMDFTEGLPETDVDLAEAIAHLIGVGLEIAVAVRDGEIVGGIGILYAPFPWNRQKTIASELFIWTDRDAPPTTLLSLLRFVERRIKERSVSLKEFVSLTSSPPGIAGVYARMGLRKTQESWMGAA